MKGLVFYNQDFLVIQEDEDVIKENISRILLTLPGERVNNPFFGSNLRLYLFELDTIMKEEVETDILTSINRWEPRVVVDAITTELQADMETFLIKVEGTNNDTLEPFTYEQLLRL